MIDEEEDENVEESKEEEDIPASRKPKRRA
jgi:hypothetical protein